MTKNEFLRELENRIRKYPDHQEIVSYYYELIQDKMDSGMSEFEAVDSLGSLDKIVRDIENERNDKEEIAIIKNDTSDNQEEKQETSNNGQPKRINGGKRFVYVLWIIATVCMCIAAISTLVVAISFMIGTVALMVVSSVIIPTSVAIAGIQFGAGLFLFGAAIVAVHYARVLVRFIFREKKVWTSNIRKGLAGE